ncbi:MAG TPA: hypothetical protein VFK05_08990 [Polyangiaceae bacterium]|nr:hypothetical protein [Polyangiaceae bacterium]
MSSYQMRGVVPPESVAQALRELVNELGDRAVAEQLGQSRATVARICARLPVLESVLFTAQAKLPHVTRPAT